MNVNTVHWFDASSSVTPMNNPITLISAVQSLGYIFDAADTLCVALQISEQVIQLVAMNVKVRKI